MDTLLSLLGIVGALCCVGMFAAVSIGKINADKPVFFIVNGLGAILILVGAWQEFDVGDLGTIAQEMIWAVISFAGVLRLWARADGVAKLKTWVSATVQAVR